MNKLDIEFWQNQIALFAGERDWDQFHTPKNLAMALSVEASELVEIFQWLTPEQSTALNEEHQKNAEEEIADILTYLLRLSDKLNIDLNSALEKKLAQNAQKYPVDKAKGRAEKYNKL